MYPMRRSHRLPVLDVVLATPAVVKAVAALPGSKIYRLWRASAQNLKRSIFCPHTAFSPFARPRRSPKGAYERRLKLTSGVTALAGVLTTTRLLRFPLQTLP